MNKIVLLIYCIPVRKKNKHSIGLLSMCLREQIIGRLLLVIGSPMAGSLFKH
jgi:hypothetical protein